MKLQIQLSGIGNVINRQNDGFKTFCDPEEIIRCAQCSSSGHFMIPPGGEHKKVAQKGGQKYS
jgi:hypothetical protein